MDRKFNIRRLVLSIILLSLFAVSQTSCLTGKSGPDLLGGILTGGTNQDGTGIGVDSNAADVDGVDSGDDDLLNGGPGSGDTKNAPSAFIPLPNLEKGILSNADSKGTVAYQAESGAYNGDYGLGIRNTTKYARWESQKDIWYVKIGDTLKTWAKSGYNLIAGDALAVADDCIEEDGFVTRLEIRGDGSVAPTAIRGHKDGDVYEIFYYDKDTCKKGLSADETSNKNFLYVAQAAASIQATTYDGAEYFQLDDDGNIAKFKFDAGTETLQMQGDIDANYVSFTTKAVNDVLAFNEGAQFVFLNDEYVSSTSILGGTDEFDSQGECKVSDGCSPVVVKNIGDKAYYGISYNVGNAIGEFIELFTDNRISFFDKAMFKTINTFKRVLALDVAVSGGVKKDILVGYTVQLGSTTKLALRLSGIHWGTSVKDPVMTAYNTTKTIEGIEIFKSQPTDDSANGNAIIFGNSSESISTGISDTIAFMSYDLIFPETCETAEPESEEWIDAECDKHDKIEFVIDPDDSLKIDNIVDLAVSDLEGTGSAVTAWALADNEVHVIDLSKKSVTKVISLEDHIGRSLNYKASAIEYVEDMKAMMAYLIVSDANHNGAIVIEVGKLAM